MFFVDSHCHIDLLNYSKIHSGIEDVLQKSIKNHVKLLLAVTTSIKNFNHVKKFIKNNKNILLSFGIHPLHINQKKYKTDTIIYYSKDMEVVAIGETGLDYYHQMDNIELQKTLFRKHIYAAIELNKPLLVHTRNSINDTISILKEKTSNKCKGIIHSFSENVDSARKILDMGFYISFSGNLTFKNSDHIREVIKFVPLKQMLLETDSPYLTPIPHRGKENQPSFLYDTALFVSKLKNVSIKTLSEHTTQNFFKLFKLKPSNFNVF
ncbi:DNAse [Buchnera aphidicola (Schlechtendalia chinensis)]|uniref:DNAse n=1 Tax=Buchnera aphidicola subsp. Schlechtendalia chinensis TaxID=118110 RepID=A0A172WDP4_BUCSC|nr:YchF/TatD family DNA exonuclease [Buchnera aphidicola]ANF17099.1 DNAse [Buchnera aphidicola (Schlechtendalia chinensis)]